MLMEPWPGSKERRPVCHEEVFNSRLLKIINAQKVCEPGLTRAHRLFFY